MLVTYILLWSYVHGAYGFCHGMIAVLIAVRAACGLAEAGAYPASGLLVTRWFPFSHRGRANSIVSFGGRIGNSLALWLTAGAIAIARFLAARAVDLWFDRPRTSPGHEDCFS